MPSGAVCEILLVNASAYSSSVNLRLSCTPPSFSINFLSSIAVFQASWPCRSIIASLHLSETSVRREAVWVMSVNVSTVISWLPTILKENKPYNTESKIVGTNKNHLRPCDKVIISPSISPKVTAGALLGFKRAYTKA